MDDTKDFGTPSANSEKLVTLNIDGVDVRPSPKPKPYNDDDYDY